MPQEIECSRRCGFVTDDEAGWRDHELNEHKPCPHCKAGYDDGQDAEYLRTYSLAHRRGCSRLAAAKEAGDG